MKKYKIYIILLLAVNIIFFMSGKDDSLRRLMLVREYDFTDTSVHHRYGDLYRLCKVDNFLETLKVDPVRIEKHGPENADIFLAGDSYFGASIGGEYISTDLENRFGYEVFDITNENIGTAEDPLGAVGRLSFDKSKNRILVIETTERFSYERAMNQYIKKANKFSPGLDGLRSFIYRTLINRQYFIEHNKLIYPVIRFKNTLDYNIFKQIDLNIGAYSDEPPMLFYNQDVKFASTTRSPQQLDMLADNIETMKNILKEKYNITLLYIIIPDKYSIYNDLVNGKYTYSGYIYELINRLIQKNIHTIDIYSAFMDYRKLHPDKILYTKSDSHFNADGKAIFIEELRKKIEEIKRGF